MASPGSRSSFEKATPNHVRRSFTHLRTKWPECTDNTPRNSRHSMATSTRTFRSSTMEPTSVRLTGPIETVPSGSVFFNAPFDEIQTVAFKITNMGRFRIGWAIKATNEKRLKLEPSSGVLAPRESCVVTISCLPFRSGKDVRADVVIVEWLNTPNDAAENFRREWLEKDEGRRKNVLIKYNY